MSYSYWTKRRKINSKLDEHLHNIGRAEHSCNISTNSTSRPNVRRQPTCVNQNYEHDEELSCVQLQGQGAVSDSDHANTHDTSGSAIMENTNPDFTDSSDTDSDTDEYHGSDSTCNSSREGTDHDLSDISDEENNCKLKASDLRSQLCHWAVTNSITHSALGQLMDILKQYHPSLPKDARTLLSTGKVHTCSDGIRKIDGGSYYHFGIASGVISKLAFDSKLHAEDHILLQINIDGLPLFKSSNMQFWPILGLLKGSFPSTPFVIGLFSGKAKPKNPEDFLTEFVSEMLELQLNGITLNGQVYKISIQAFVCDSPARAFIKQVKSHSGYSACEKCTCRGVWEGKITFPTLDAPLRTDESFNNESDEDHHIGPNPLKQLSLGMVSQFPLDYMHLVCLGVMRRLLMLWMKGPLNTRLGPQVKLQISQCLLSLRHFIPIEFARKPRALAEVERWKATEFRLFLLYTGPVVLRGKIPEAMYKNFMLLSTAVNILANPVLCHTLCNYANELLVCFVQHFCQLYGKEQVVYNVHCLVHLAADVKMHGPLDEFAAFPFENFLKSLKKMVRKPTCVLQQVILRLSEISLLSSPNNTNPSYMHETSDVNLKMQHMHGPLPTGDSYNPCTQFRDAVLPDYIVSKKTGNNCVKVGSHIALIMNIFQCKSGVYIMYTHFLSSRPFFNYPVDSRHVEVYKVSRISDHLLIADIQSVKGKYVLLPYQNDHVAFALIHTSLKSFQG